MGDETHYWLDLWGFQNRVAHCLSGMKTQRDITGRWVYPPMYVAMSETGLEKVKIYVLHCQNTMDHYIVVQQVLELCLAVERRLGASLIHKLWEKESLDLAGVRTAVAVQRGVELEGGTDSGTED